MGAAKKKLTDTRRLKVAQLMLRGLPQSEIASKLKVHQSTISRDQQEVLAEWKSQRTTMLDEYLELQLARLERQYFELNEAWDRSIGKTVTVTKKEIGQGGAAETVTRTEVLNGDPRYQSEMRAILQEINKLLGLYPAEKPGAVGVTVNVGVAVQAAQKETSGLTDEELDKAIDERIRLLAAIEAKDVRPHG